jgi:hypothetical protein
MDFEGYKGGMSFIKAKDKENSNDNINEEESKY